ncbi:helix-turn-helix domain-containing protein [Cellulomonas sp. NPDC055163]
MQGYGRDRARGPRLCFWPRRREGWAAARVRSARQGDPQGRGPFAGASRCVTGLDRAYVGHVENGRRSFSLGSMWQLARALGTSPGAFLTATQGSTGPTPGDPDAPAPPG